MPALAVYLLTLQKTNANVERALHFIATFTAEVPQRSNDSCTIFIQVCTRQRALTSFLNWTLTGLLTTVTNRCCEHKRIH